MATVVQIGPEDHGRPMTLDAFRDHDFVGGYHYELINGKLYVSPEANAPEDWVEKWIYGKLCTYSWQHPEVLNYVTNKARVFVPGHKRITCPEPDLAGYRRFPLHRAIREIRWQNVSPILVGEVLSIEDPYKDLVRNVELYLLIPSIKEYWIVDTREDPERPSMRVYRRHRREWRVIDVPYGGLYATKLLPHFELVMDPRA